MKKHAIALLTLALLGGCASTEPESMIGWQQDNQVVMASTTIELKSNLWINQMPTIGEVQDQNLHGALYLTSDSQLDAHLTATQLIIRQGEREWLIEGDLLELRSHNEHHWEVAFVWQMELDIEQPVDIAVEVEQNGQVAWLVERKVSIDTVF